MTQPSQSAPRRSGEDKKEAGDVFVERILSLVAWAKANTQTLVLVGVVIVVVGAGALYWTNYRTSVNDQAVAQLEQVQQAVALGDREAAKTALYDYVGRFKGTVYAVEASLLLGQVLLEGDEPDAAMEVLAPAVRTMDEEPLGIQAAFLMAAAYEETGRTEEAERLLLRIAASAELPFQVREAQAAAARIRGATGDWPGAAKLYQDILATLEEADPDRNYWEMRLAEANARG